MATQSELAQIQHILGKRRNSEQSPLDLSARKKSREYLDSHKDVEKRRRDRINTCLDTIRTLVPLCHQLPRHRRVDKADLLDLAIIYLRMVNQFLEKIGVTDIFSAAHQQVALFTSLEKWVKDQGESHSDVPSFTKEILTFLEKEMETASHVIASQQTAGNARSDTDSQQTPEWLKHENGGLEDDSATRSSGSDEEQSLVCHGDREDRSSGSEDFSFVGSPGNPPLGSGIYRQCSHAYSTENPYVTFVSSGCTSTLKSSVANGYHNTCYTLSCQNTPKRLCVDKAVNTDASSTNFTWPPDSTFTLPIVSGKIVLHTPMGAYGSNNLNAPVTMHAEIHSTPPQNPQLPVPCQTFKPNPEPYSDDRNGCRKSSPVHDEPMCLEARSTTSASPTGPQFNHTGTSHFVTGAVPYPQSSFSREKIHHGLEVPDSVAHPVSTCVRVIERPPHRMIHEDTYSTDRSEEKSYTSLVPLRQSADDRDSKNPSSQSGPALVNPHGSDAYYHGQRSGPFSKRYLASLGHQQEASNDVLTARNRSCSCCPTASSALKLKRLMVHRHQTQHIMSR